MGSKNDKNDAAAIVEADSRPGMRYVPEKSIGQQDIQCLHRVRQRWMKNKTALINQIWGLGLEYGIAIPEGAHKIMDCLPDYLEDAENELTTLSRELSTRCCRNSRTISSGLKRWICVLRISASKMRIPSDWKAYLVSGHWALLP